MEFPKIRTIRYLGSKRKIVDDICNLIKDKVPSGSTIADLFSGTNCISYALKDSYKIYSNDIQRYSYVIGKALLSNGIESISKKEAESDLEQAYLDNYDALRTYYDEDIEKEDTLTESCLPTFQQEYERFSKEYPNVISSHPDGRYKRLVPLLSNRTIDDYRKNPKKAPYMLFSTYYVNGYFGIKQCLQIDSLRFAIDQLKASDKWRRCFYLCALIYTINSCVSSPGHFAQFLTPHSDKAYARICKERRKVVQHIFYDQIDYLSSALSPSKYKNEVWCADYQELFDEENDEYYAKIKDADLIYADPPYTDDHYSRYYHVLETLVRYDYPQIEGKGRYRTDRFFSGFSLKSKVCSEFRSLISLTASLDCRLLISYNNDGLVPEDQLTKMCKEHYSRLDCYKIPYNHSNQGRRNSECSNRSNPRRELLIYCEDVR